MKRTYIIMTTTMSLFLLNSCSDKKNYEAPTQLISTVLASDLNDRYINERSGIIEESIQRQDANAVWYSIEELENYIYYAKCEAKKTDKEINGIRFYFGVYPNDTIRYKEKAGLTTLFLSPTMKRINVDKVDKSQNKTKRLQSPTPEENVDVTEVQPLNYGGIGHPPIVEYPISQ
ncbi:hypothetical protein [Flavobacterium sp.]|uniref:hypothetical protein n=1 Tax=Flavobacterium sp. TaxID=239 RepID=UPI00286D9F63|nr:hypothetical protein [Flavobacterium sp.]